MKKLRMILLAVIIAIGVSGTGNAAYLSDLADNGSITVGDKLFYDWDVTVLYNDRGVDFDASSIEVVGLDDDSLNPGISFITNGAFQVNDFNMLDVEISFWVTVEDPAWLVEGVSAELTGFEFGANNSGGAIAIGEDIYTEAGDSLFSFDPWLEVDNLWGTQTLSDSVTFAPQKSIQVVKDIVLVGDEDGDYVSLDSFEQRFHQTPVPEPSTLLLMGVGLLGVCGATRKKRA